MSNHLISTTFKRRLGSGTRKAVMALMADKASDDGRGVWASKQSMADELDLTKKTIITAVQSLIDDGLLTVVGERRCATGHTVEYAIDVVRLERLPLVGCWQRREDAKASGVNATPVADLHRCNSDTTTGVNATPKPPLEPLPLSPSCEGDAPHEILHFDVWQSETAGLDETLFGDPPPPKEPSEQEPPKPAKPHRLPDGWVPPDPATLPPLAKAAVSRWPDGAYHAVCELFRLYWTAATDKRAKKTEENWRATLANWLIKDDAKIQRDAKFGVDFTRFAPAKDEPVGARSTLPEVAAKAREDHRSAAIHAGLREVLGERAWARWFGGVALVVGRTGTLNIVTPSAFMTNWIEQQHRPLIERLGRQVIGAAFGGVKFQTEAGENDDGQGQGTTQQGHESTRGAASG